MSRGRTASKEREREGDKRVLPALLAGRVIRMVTIAAAAATATGGSYLAARHRAGRHTLRPHHVQHHLAAAREVHQQPRSRTLLDVSLCIETLHLTHTGQYILVVLDACAQILDECVQLLQRRLIQHGQQRLVVDQSLLYVAIVDGEQTLMRGVCRILVDSYHAQLLELVYGRFVGVHVALQLRLERHMKRYQLPRCVGRQAMYTQSLHRVVEAASTLAQCLAQRWFVLRQGVQQLGAALSQSALVRIRKETHQLPDHRLAGHIRLGCRIQSCQSEIWNIFNLQISGMQVLI